MTNTVAIERYDNTEHSTSTSIGEKQWACLEELENHYKNQPMNRFSENSFADDEWDVFGSNTYTFRWKVWLPKAEQKPLLLLCKVAAYTLIQIRGVKQSTVQPRVVGFINAFKEMQSSKNILIAKENQRFGGLAELLPEDISLVANKSLHKDGKLGLAPFEFLQHLESMESSIFRSSYFMLTGLVTPWKEVGIPVRVWVPRLKKAFGIEKKEGHFAPLTNECSSAIITKALALIEDYGDIITGIFDEVEAGNKKFPPTGRKRVAKNVSMQVKEKYADKIHDLMPVEYGAEGRINQSFYSNLQRLTQSACAWIVLLTTGLRNIDMRKLSPNGLFASKRSDDIFYLISNIRKTDIVNYVLPVPPQTAVAFNLAKAAKIDRGSEALFHKGFGTNRQVDSEVNDKYYMGEDRTFNEFLWYFADYFNIKLETIHQGTEVTAHCGRSTLAGFIGANSAAAILILKKLFGHSNDLMPDAYINYNPLVIAARNKNILDAQKSLASDMARAVSRGDVAGIKGEQLLKGAETIRQEIADEFKSDSLTEMDMQVKLRERLQEMLLDRMIENHVFALLTPMSVVCLRTTNDSTDSPCAVQGNHASRKEQEISKELTDVMATLPNPAQCVGVRCSDALVGKPWSDGLLRTFQYYLGYLKSSHQVYDLAQEAKRFVANYRDVLEELYGEEVANGR